MTIRVRKFIGLLAMLLWVTFYALLAMGIAGNVLPNANGFVKFAYYSIAGLSWILPMLPLIRWMNRPDKSAQS